MFNLIDAIGIIIIFICAIVAFKKGFVKTFFGFVSTFVAIALAFALCNTGVKIIQNNTQIDEWIETTLQSALNSSKDENDEQEINDDVDDQDLVKETFENLPENIKNFVGLEEYKENAKSVVIENAKEIILKILSWIIIYLLVRIILFIICLVFDGIMSIPFLKQINNLIGLVLGIVLGLFRIYVVLALISFFVTIVPMTPVVDAIKASLIISVMYENNLLVSLIF